MKVILGRYLDSGAWPDAVTYFGAGRKAVDGVKICGPAGFLSLLEEKLGLPVRDAHGSVRIAVWEGMLRQRIPSFSLSGEPFYAASFHADSWNTAKRILLMRDELKEAGALEGSAEELSKRADTISAILPRLAEFLRLEAEHLSFQSYAPSSADRLRLILQELSFCKKLGSSLSCGVNSVTLATPEAHWQAPWRKLLGLLRDCGVSIMDADSEAANFQLQDFSCKAERISLVSDRLSEAAEALAAVLRARLEDASLGGIAFLRREASYELDGALERNGLPGTACRERSTARPFIQLLPLYLRLQLLPFDPETLRQFLLLPVNPLPQAVCARLLRALQRQEFSPWAEGFETWPEFWKQAFRDRENTLFEQYEELVAWFCPPRPVSGDSISPEDMAKSAEKLLKWAAKNSADNNAELMKTAALCKRFMATADCLKKARVSGLDMLSFEKLLDAVLGEGEKSTDGRKALPWPVLSDAGQFWSNVDTVIWWDFADDGHALRESFVWSNEERDWLEKQDCPLADINIERCARSYASTAPFRFARRVITVTPRFHDKEESLPHPLSDFLPKPTLTLEASAILGNAGHAGESGTLPDFWQVEREELRQPPSALPEWQEEQDRPIPLPERLNPSGLDSILSCPAYWYFKNVLKLDADRTKLAGEPIVRGNLAHEIMEELLKEYQGAELPDDARLEQRILEMMACTAPRIAARYALAENEVVRRSMAEKLAKSFKVFLQKMDEHGLVFLNREQPYAGELDGIAFNGRYDLMLGRKGQEGPAVIVDMKWSSGRKYEEQVKGGTATQLAAYHYLLEHGRRVLGRENGRASLAEPSPQKLEDAWFFLLPKSAVHAVSDGPDGKTLEDHWKEVEQAWKVMRADLEKGILRIAASPKADEEPCRYCGYKKLCGMKGTASEDLDGDEE